MSDQTLENAIRGANAQQAEAINTIDGPVLVVAGPGTGKTQLLSLRVANILQKRDINPENILCLTFTEAGAQAMSKRLSGFIGKKAYQVRISTFHAFASSLRDRFIEYFNRSPFDSLITSLQAKKMVSELLKGLSVSDPLYSKPSFKGVPSNLGDVISLIGKIKTSGLSTDSLREIVSQGIDTLAYLREKTELAAIMTVAIPSNKAAKAELCDELKIKTALIFESLPATLKEKRVSLAGSYEPLGLYLARVFRETDWYEGDNNSTTGFQALRKQFFDTKNASLNTAFEKKYRAMNSALDIYDRYQEFLETHGQYDFNDMILDAILAIESNPELEQLLQEQYQYILIDEFQDTNGSQMRIVELLTRGLEQPNIMAVGDDDQAIMRFQGASVAFLKQFEESYGGTKRIVLKTNYRSIPSIVRLGGDVAAQIEGRSEASKTEKNLVAFKKEENPTSFCVKTFASKELQYFEVARSIKERIDMGFVRNAKNPSEALAVIAWQHSSLAGLIPYLKMFEIDFTYSIVTTIAKTESLQGLLACMRYVSFLASGDVGRADPLLPQILAAPELKIAATEYVSFALSAKRDDGGWTAALRKSDSVELGALRKWLDQATLQAATRSAKSVILNLAKPFIEFYKLHAQDDPFVVLEFNYAISALLDFVQGECGTSCSLKLGSIVALLDEADRFGEHISVGIPVSRPEAIALKTAHNSKGLEYDLVYLIDADESTWHGGGKKGGINCPNIYLNEKRDSDDMRRLLFVALTRARYELEISLGKSGVVAELLEHVSETPVEMSANSIEMQSMVLWQDRYYPDDESLQSLVHSVLRDKRLSASSLNSFVKFDENDTRDGFAYIMREAFRFPQAPITYFEFGTITHKYLELYLNYVVKAQSISADDLLAKMHKDIASLDFGEADLSHMHEQLDLIALNFIPKSGEYLNSDAMAEQWIRAEVDNVPLVGRSDLLLFNSENKTIWICDFKTGSPKSLGDDYQRQLVFYKILIEGSGQYAGWKVLGGMDIFIEPDTTTKELAPVKKISAPVEEVDHVRKLIHAVYWRIQNADFNTSAFDPSGLDKKEVQRAYENWLIRDYEWRSCD